MGWFYTLQCKHNVLVNSGVQRPCVDGSCQLFKQNNTIQGHECLEVLTLDCIFLSFIVLNSVLLSVTQENIIKPFQY